MMERPAAAPLPKPPSADHSTITKKPKTKRTRRAEKMRWGKGHALVFTLRIPNVPNRTRKVYEKLQEVAYKKKVDLIVDAIDTLAIAKGINPQAIDKYTRKLAKLNPQAEANLSAIVDLPEDQAPFDIPAGSLAELTD